MLPFIVSVVLGVCVANVYEWTSAWWMRRRKLRLARQIISEDFRSRLANLNPELASAVEAMCYHMDNALDQLAPMPTIVSLGTGFSLNLVFFVLGILSTKYHWFGL